MVRLAWRSAVAWLLFAAAAAAVPEGPYAPDVPETGSVEAIAKDTTDPKFTNPWVAYVPASSSVTSPTKYLGHVAGKAGELSRTEKVYGYFRELARTSPRVRVETLGKSEEGREILLVAVADEDGIRNLDRWKAATAALADPRTTSPEAAEKIIATARPIYYFNAGLHSTETGSPEMVMELAYRLAVSEQPMIQQIRKNLIVLINPVSEPDGRDKAVDWYYRFLKGKTDWDNLPETSPPYWGYYAFHDNNRDTHQKALALTRAVHKMFYDYHPTVVHDLHESIPLLHTWNGTGPYNENLDPIAIGEWLETSFHEVRALTALGMPGVWTWGFGESWGLHYLDSVASNHNSLGRGYETFGNGSAETFERTLRPSEERYVDRPVTGREWYRPWPPDKKFLWSLRDNTNYMESGCLAILDWTAKNAKDSLRNFYRKGYNSWQKGVKGGPYAFVIPADQGDPRRVAQMIEVIRGQGIEVARLTAPATVKEGTFPKGSYLVRLDQPYRNYAVDLLEPQKFPESPYEPYDDVSWSLPVHYGLEARRIDDEKIRSAGAALLSAAPAVPGKISGPGPVYLLKDTGQEALLAARFRLARFRVSIAEKAFKSGGADYPAGSWILPTQDGLAAALAPVARELSVAFDSAAAVPDVPAHESLIPRLAVWHLWADTEATGWLRLALDQEKIPYAYIRDEEIRAGGLREKYDVVLYAHNSASLKTQIHGIDTRWGPMPYTKTPEFPSHGVPDASEDITGGIGWGGMANLQKFLDAGGLLIALGNGSALPIEGGLVRGVRKRGGGSVDTPGVELKVRFARPDHPLAYGYPEETSAFRGNLPVYDLAPSDRRFLVLQWGTRPKKEDREDALDEDKSPEKDEKGAKEPAKKSSAMVVSGGAKHEEDLEGHPAILDLPAGKGRVIAFNFNPMHRDLNHSDFRFLWNGILNWNA
ncbi:MAG: M14 family zinc carboxypeptidase, partial [Thermoanaerobaculia bacterium]